MTYLAGIDIGGTKCAVVLGRAREGAVDVLSKRMYPTPPPAEAVASFIANLDELLAAAGVDRPDAIGISCGSPLDSKRGLVLSPPNLPDWDRLDVVGPLKARYGVPVGLQNDANACALAEWKWGAGQGTEHMVFLTFGTGMGAGLILNGRLYVGKNDMAGEVGHVRLEDDGPIGYGKAGSFEGFCSGGGIAVLARTMTAERLRSGGEPPSFCASEAELDAITAKTVGLAAQAGDPLALDIYRIVGEKLGKGLAMLADILNPERIVIGSIYGRQQALLEPIVKDVLAKEALPITAGACDIVPAALGESVGDLASLSVALNEIH
ncbi:ROK family protein [Paenibacillus antri]|uniref:ROK family protein n=1 Tax=Paenibacillus antri TaxID=2582848 RepID=A0A5R9GHG1_9BACL|nr:ROK family protein [Paenibacillus antri]TLS53640.1 ROK family protein [Paenibacillus antri]